LRVLTIKILDDGIYRGLRKQAEESGRTVEDEASYIIGAAVHPLPPEDAAPRTGKDLYEAIRAIVEPF
jgi:plasmid stability protein